MVRWRWVTAAAILPAAAGCAIVPRPAPFPTQLPTPTEAVRRYTDDIFDVAAFYKPRPGSLTGPAADLAPLIMRSLDRPRKQGEDSGQVTSQTGWTPLGHGERVVSAAHWAVANDLAEYEAVYYYSWNDAGATFTLMITTGEDGFPLTYMVGVCDPSSMPDDLARPTMFVARSLEDRAIEAFGGPLPGRRYAIEQSTRDTPGVIVSGVVEDGPVPMGPYVYVDGESRRVTTLLCRCSPSQVERIEDTDYYEVEPTSFSRLFARWSSRSGIRAPGCGKRETFDWERSLRWPDP